MSMKVVGKEASVTNGELYFQTYQKLLKQKERIDKDLLELQGKMFKDISQPGEGSTDPERKKYVPRLDNTIILAKAIRKCMIPKKEMTMKDILKSLKEKDLYHTRSGYLYTMVNNKIHTDEKIEKVGRGLYVYSSKAKVAMA